MDTTPLGYPYPEPGDAITDYPAVAQALAEELDADATALAASLAAIRNIEGTTIAAAAAAVGGAAEGKMALVQNAYGGRMVLVYDSVLGKWVGPESHHAIIAGTMGFSGSGLSSGGVADCLTAAISPLLQGKAWYDCGLRPQMNLRGYFGMTWTGATTTRIVQSFAYNAGEPGGTNPYHTGYMSYGTTVPIVGTSATPELLHHDWVWLGPPGGAGVPVQYDTFLPTFYITGTGTGTASYAAKNVTVGIRWLSA